MGGIKGGELELSSVVANGSKGPDRQYTKLRHSEVKVSEGTSLVFSNDYCYHRVRKLYGNGSRKIIAFFLLRDSSVYPFDARNVAVNVKHHAMYFVEQSLREMNQYGHLWLIRMIQQYVVGDKGYISMALDAYRESKRAQDYDISTQESQMASPIRHRMRRHS